ncbi:hypothetical protein F5B19DRAFT_273875 [Rostrohypoxylon terebratum]|nr:hypothetical protein F5B19DRAFT_273875 [Rostrohypoxylon terebratum]
MVAQPYMYDSDRRDSRLPEKPFDPKAITRASWEPPPKRKKKQDGPLIAFGRHPDAQAVPTGRTAFFRPMSSTTKWWIKFMRYVQLFFRVLEMIGGGGLLTLMILIGNVDPLTAWVMRITPGVVAISCVYAIWHFIRPANARPPASSAAYQLFAGVMDLAVVPLYAFGVISVVNYGATWKLIVTASPELTDALIQSEHYLLLSAGGLHVISLGISIYLGLMFRRIANMPPDMNPLESHLTSRVSQHKRNKSSVATSYTTVSDDSNSKRLSTPLENYRNSGAGYEDLSRPPSIPFMHTRTGSRDSFASSKRDSRADLPSRQYQITPGNSPRNSVADMKRMSGMSGLTISTSRTAQRGNYTEVPLHETGVSTPSSSRPSSGVTLAPMPSPSAQQPINASPTRVAKFTEAWYASESLINRTQERQRAMNAAERERQRESRKYEAINQRYNFDDGSEDDRDSDRENNYDVIGPDYSDIEDNGAPSSPINVTAHLHPNPLRLNPVPATPPKDTAIAGRKKTPFHADGEPLSDVNLNDRRVSGSQDIADQQPSSGVTSFWRRSTLGRSSTSKKPNPRNRNSSIQPDGDFYSKPYGELKPATPPIMVGAGGNVSGGGGGGRQVSSGNDFGDLGAGTSYRRNVSGKIAEEGLAGKRYSRYSILNDDDD